MANAVKMDEQVFEWTPVHSSMAREGWKGLQLLLFKALDQVLPHSLLIKSDPSYILPQSSMIGKSDGEQSIVHSSSLLLHGNYGGYHQSLLLSDRPVNPG